MLHMAIGARWRERLVGVMDGAIVASQAGLIGGALLEAGLRNMAGTALLSQQGVRASQRTGVVRFRASRQGVPSQPREARDDEHARKNAPPARNAVQGLEVIQIDALRQLLGGADASGHLVPQRHDGMNSTQHEQGD